MAEYKILTLNEKLGKPECPYLIRWMLKLPFGYTLRLHHWLSSDDKRAMHNHPWNFWTFVLCGSYEDWTEGELCAACNGVGKRYTRPVEYVDFVVCQACEGRGFAIKRELMQQGSFSFRPADHKHTVNVLPGGCWTILLMGPKKQPWGFFWKRLNGKYKFKKANKWFLEHGNHPCDQDD